MAPRACAVLPGHVQAIQRCSKEATQSRMHHHICNNYTTSGLMGTSGSGPASVVGGTGGGMAQESLPRGLGKSLSDAGSLAPGDEPPTELAMNAIGGCNPQCA